MTELVLFVATVLNAAAASFSAWYAFKTVKTGERTLEEQRKVRESERLEKRYEQQIEAPLREYLNVLSTEWYVMLQSGLQELDAHVARRASPAETAAFVNNLTFSLRETWRRASFGLLIGSEKWNRSLVRELGKARDELDEKVSEVLNAQSAPRRRVLRHSLGNIVYKHSLSVLDRVAKYGPESQPVSPQLAPTKGSVHLLGPGGAPTRGQTDD
jgi:hypothetical protein